MAIDSNQIFPDIHYVASEEAGIYRNGLKRLLDIVILLILAVPAVFILAVLALVIICFGDSPFYSQDRVGKNGRVFRMWKLRSMVPNAEEKLQEHLANNPIARQEWDLHQKLKNDPRITWVGRFIRKSSMDELPQVWNVLVGDMSFVGPRPMMREQRKLYPGVAYFALLPGITGFWQISERNETSFAERAFYDMSYYQDLSLVTDLKVLLQTCRVVLKCTGY